MAERNGEKRMRGLQPFSKDELKFRFKCSRRKSTEIMLISKTWRLVEGILDGRFLLGDKIN